MIHTYVFSSCVRPQTDRQTDTPIISRTCGHSSCSCCVRGASVAAAVYVRMHSVFCRIHTYYMCIFIRYRSTFCQVGGSICQKYRNCHKSLSNLQESAFEPLFRAAQAPQVRYVHSKYCKRNEQQCALVFCELERKKSRSKFLVIATASHRLLYPPPNHSSSNASPNSFAPLLLLCRIVGAATQPQHTLL